jgi:hexokinase
MDIVQFMKSRGMYAEESIIPHFGELFSEDLTAALTGRASMLQPLRSRLGVPGIPRDTKELLAVDFGGTNIRLARMRFDENSRAVIDSFTQEKIQSGRLEKDYFFGWLADRIAAYDIEDVGFVFSYQAEILPGGDAKIVSLSKGLSVPDATGLVLGEEINKVLVSRGLKPRRYTIINDTTAVFLSAAAQLKDPESLAAAVIAGTGSNCCCVWNGEIINIEWELFRAFERGSFDIRLDEESDNPGEHLTGKQVGGKYLAMLVDMCAEEALKEGVTADGSSDEQAVRDAIYSIIYGRAAIFIVSMLRGVVAMSPAAASAKEKGGSVWVCIEGGTYDHAPGYKEKIDSLIDKYISKELGIDCRIMQVEQAGITGAAIAALA